MSRSGGADGGPIESGLISGCCWLTAWHAAYAGNRWSGADRAIRFSSGPGYVVHDLMLSGARTAELSADEPHKWQISGVFATAGARLRTSSRWMRGSN
jgi:hypothetical protein